MASAYLALPLSSESATPRLCHCTGFPVLVLVLSLVPLVLFLVSVFIVLVISLISLVSVFFVLVHRSRALFSLT